MTALFCMASMYLRISLYIEISVSVYLYMVLILLHDDVVYTMERAAVHACSNSIELGILIYICCKVMLY